MPWNSAGLVYCGYSSKPENDSLLGRRLVAHDTGDEAGDGFEHDQGSGLSPGDSM